MQLQLLDSIAGTSASAAAFAQLWEQLQDLRRQLDAARRLADPAKRDALQHMVDQVSVALSLLLLYADAGASISTGSCRYCINHPHDQVSSSLQGLGSRGWGPGCRVQGVDFRGVGVHGCALSARLTAGLWGLELRLPVCCQHSCMVAELGVRQAQHITSLCLFALQSACFALTQMYSCDKLPAWSSMAACMSSRTNLIM